ncbi:diguanylate cyclase [Sporosarcina sp. ACRSM]|uniref:sensor domain-containing diguanylate cyclase n=1 Tax=Sporosarcina sp. ACRSM TaxID=2918216 RepID=UPI001EF6744D|nr:diguanylate cyclase [Sporosarcina sp. ACRSM]MCG7337198.1 diguanylate cyclase [Sporosarcina sp. ACRSM]
MKNKVLLYIPFLLIIIAAFLFNLLAPLTTNAKDDSKSINLGTYYEFYRDSTNKLTIENMLSDEFEGEFARSQQKYLFFWHTDDTIWLRLDAAEIIRDPEESYWLEATDKLNSIEVYLVRDDDTYDIQKGGMSNIKNQEIDYRSNLFYIEDPSIEAIYVKLDGVMPLNLISFFYTTKDFIEKVIAYKFYTGIFYGFMISLLIYNLFLFFSLKEKAYLYYVFYMLCFIFYQAAMNSLDLELLGPFFSEHFFTRTIPLVGNILFIFMILFGKEFLDLKRNLPQFNQVANGLLGVTVIFLFFIYFTENITITDYMSLIMAIVVPSFLWLSGLLVLLKGHKMARYYMIGWTVLLGSIMVQALGFLSVIPFHPRIYEEVPAIGAAFEAIFLSLALGDKINIMKKEHQASQEKLNEKLEHLVAERTQQLERVNAELEVLAHTDQLTQLPNRFQLDRLLKEGSEHAQNKDVPLSLILLDIDQFKAVNDNYGHQVGDLVLQEVAMQLKESVLREGTIGRWGGEEFLIICPQSAIGTAIDLAEKTRRQIEEHTFPVVVHKTVSFGVTSYVPGDTLHSMLSRCDKALYHAKNNGRNRVEYLLAND